MMDASAKYRMLIDGQMTDGEGTFAVINPATEQPAGLAPDSSRDQLDAAVKAARRAFPVWRDTPVDERKHVVRAIADTIENHIDELSRLLTAEQGKTLADSRADIGRGVVWLRAMTNYDLPVETNEESPERHSVTYRVPLGVVGAIAPWNFPIALACWKIGPALVTGNCVVLKPSPLTPLTTLRIAELVADIVPAGVLNVVSGGDALGPWMTSHPDIDKISFTGSSQTGRKVMESAAPTLKRLTLELGGNDAAIVLPDVDVDIVAERLFWAAFRNSGQVCIASKRIFVHEAIYERLAAALVDYARTVEVGDGTRQGVQLGPVQNRQQFERVVQLIEDAKANGYRFLVGGDVEMDAPGFFVPITVLDNPPDDARIVTEEQFGPVVPLLRFASTEEAIERANQTEYGLGGSVWTDDMEEGVRVARRLDTGTVWINDNHHTSPFAAFGGHKQSGLGVENGLEGLLEYTATQTISVRKTPVVPEARP